MNKKLIQTLILTIGAILFINSGACAQIGGPTFWFENTTNALSPVSDSLGLIINASSTINSSLAITGNTILRNVAYTWPATAGTNNYVLSTNGSGVLSWVAQSGGGGSGGGPWTTSTDDLLIYPVDTTDVVLIGSNATTTKGYIFEVIGSSLFDKINTLGATSTSFYTPNLGINSEYFTDLTGTGLTITSGALTVATSTLHINLNDTIGILPLTKLAATSTMHLNLSDLIGVLPFSKFQATSTIHANLNDSIGVLGTTKGGTGLSSFTTNQFFYASGASTMAQMATSSMHLNLNDLIGILPLTKLAATSTIHANLSDTIGTLPLSRLVAGVAGAYAYDFGGASSLEAPNAAAPTVDAEGEFGFDTSGRGQLVYYASSTVHALTDEKYINATFSTSTLRSYGAYGTTGTSTMEFAGKARAWTIKDVYCKITSGTGTAILKVGDGTNWLASMVCDVTGVVAILSNNTFTAREEWHIAIGTGSATVDQVALSIIYTIDRE